MEPKKVKISKKPNSIRLGAFSNKKRPQWFLHYNHDSTNRSHSEVLHFELDHENYTIKNPLARPSRDGLRENKNRSAGMTEHFYYYYYFLLSESSLLFFFKFPLRTKGPAIGLYDDVRFLLSFLQFNPLSESKFRGQ